MKEFINNDLVKEIDNVKIIYYSLHTIYLVLLIILVILDLDIILHLP